MVSYAWQTYSQYQSSNKRHKDMKKKYMEDFKKSFSREGVEVYFLGMFGCVNSVATVFQAPGWFRRSSGYLPEAPAIHMRHAVSIGERRGQFKPALIEGFVESKTSCKEVWFAGQHGDIGSGWKPERDQPFLLSDLPLAWMLKEVLELEIQDERKHGDYVHDGSIRLTKVRFVEDRLREALQKGEMKIDLSQKEKDMLDPHDYLKLGRAVGVKGKIKSLAWWLIEVLPFAHLELRNGKWVLERFPPNLGRKRDVPSNAHYHPSVAELRKSGLLDKDDKPNIHQAPDGPRT